jgi:hypothetical protein
MQKVQYRSNVRLTYIEFLSESYDRLNCVVHAVPFHVDHPTPLRIVEFHIWSSAPPREYVLAYLLDVRRRIDGATDLNAAVRRSTWERVERDKERPIEAVAVSVAYASHDTIRATQLVHPGLIDQKIIGRTAISFYVRAMESVAIAHRAHR